ncbi:MAG: hypothetical protein BIFFINMI_02280 [Phycisphaerae bacterium]|nr:hypothetical protein [Phycisphaerae bacterium]
MSRKIPTRHILAFGGGGIWAEHNATPMREFLLGLTGKDRPRVCLLPTATGDEQRIIDAFYGCLTADLAATSHVPLFDRLAGPADPCKHLLSQDLIWVGGGNTANMLAIWRVHGIDRALRRAWESGVVLAGGSAGAICWFHGGTTDSFGPLAAINDGLKFLRGSFCPHYDAEPGRRPLYRRLVASGRLPSGLAMDDGAAAHFVGTKLAEVVTWRPSARGFRMTRRGSRAAETPLPVRCLARKTT